MPSVYYTKSSEQTIELGARLGATLKPGDVVLLFGDLGAGKTHFTKGIAQGLGVQALIKSPTYAYVNEYPLQGDGVFYHYDLYRLEAGSDLTSLGFHENLQNPAAINVVEWADRLRDDLPTRFIRVNLMAEGDTRSIAIAWHTPGRLTSDSVESYYAQWQTPMHVRDHCRQVANVGRQLAQAYIDAGHIVDIDFIQICCLLHDMCRVCDFKTLERDKFEEEITNEKWQKWVDLRAQFEGQHHADIAFDALKAEGFLESAEVIRLHKSTNLMKEPESYQSLEQMIVYYADKRVAHTTIVSIARRFEEGRKRYAAYNSPKEEWLYENVEKAVLQLEKVLFEKINLEPGEIE